MTYGFLLQAQFKRHIVQPTSCPKHTRTHIIHCTLAFGQFAWFMAHFFPYHNFVCKSFHALIHSMGVSVRIRGACNWIKWACVCVYKVEISIVCVFSHVCALCMVLPFNDFHFQSMFFQWYDLQLFIPDFFPLVRRFPFFRPFPIWREKNKNSWKIFNISNVLYWKQISFVCTETSLLCVWLWGMFAVMREERPLFKMYLSMSQPK